MRLVLPEIGIILHAEPGPKGRPLTEEGVAVALRSLLRERARVSLVTPAFAEAAHDGGVLVLRRYPDFVRVEWFAQPPGASPATTSLALWLRACVAGPLPAGQLRSERDSPSLIMAPGGCLLLRVKGLSEWLAVGALGCDPLRLSAALADGCRNKAPYAVRSPYEAEVDGGDGLFILRLGRGRVTARWAERPLGPPGQPWTLRRFLLPCLRQRDGTSLTTLQPADIAVSAAAGSAYRRMTGQDLEIKEALLRDLWAPETTLLAMSLPRRSWVLRGREFTWKLVIFHDRLAIAGVTDRRFELHRFRNSEVFLTNHGEERFRLRIATEWEQLCGITPLQRDLNTKFLLQRLKGQQHLVSADFGHFAVIATAEVTAIVKRSRAQLAVISVWPTRLDHPRAVEEAVLTRLGRRPDPEEEQAAPEAHLQGPAESCRVESF
jgi:hypothetical protein